MLGARELRVRKILGPDRRTPIDVVFQLEMLREHATTAVVQYGLLVERDDVVPRLHTLVF